jgi:hypothetical protein
MDFWVSREKKHLARQAASRFVCPGGGGDLIYHFPTFIRLILYHFSFILSLTLKNLDIVCRLGFWWVLQKQKRSSDAGAWNARELSSGQRLFNFIDTKTFVSVFLKQNIRWVQRHSLRLSVYQHSPDVFFGW